MALVTGEELAAVLDLAYVADDDDGPGYDRVAAAADTSVSGLLTAGDHDDHPLDREAALAIAKDLFAARHSTGGELVGPDFQPQQSRVSLYLTKRYGQLWSPCADVGGWVG